VLGDAQPFFGWFLPAGSAGASPAVRQREQSGAHPVATCIGFWRRIVSVARRGRRGVRCRDYQRMKVGGATSSFTFSSGSLFGLLSALTPTTAKYRTRDGKRAPWKRLGAFYPGPPRRTPAPADDKIPNVAMPKRNEPRLRMLTELSGWAVIVRPRAAARSGCRFPATSECKSLIETVGGSCTIRSGAAESAAAAAGPRL